MEAREKLVQKLEELVKSTGIGKVINIHHLSLIGQKDDLWLYVHVGDYGMSKKRIDISCNSEFAIFTAFALMLAEWDRYDYV